MSQIIYLIGVILFVYIIIGLLLNYIGLFTLIIMSFILFCLFFFKNAENYNITNKQWRLFALLGTVSTGLTLLINGFNAFRNSKETNLQNIDNYYRVGLEATKDMEDTFIKYKKELGYLFNDIYGVIGKKQEHDYLSTRNLDLEYLAAFKMFRSIEIGFLLGYNIYGITKLTEPDFQGTVSTMYTIFGSNLMKQYWLQMKHLFNNDVVAAIDYIII